ncbi:hypothetical protein [Pyrococcus kukulkanii]|uniref:hypothetical protein n=1 Tax=Pyrococcus kukulkanii TaxID=1609559 RepID=UPI0035651ADB
MRGKLVASDVEKVIRLFQRRETQEAVSEWIVQLAKKIHERPEDIIWFFEELRKRKEWDKKLEELEKSTEDLSPEDLFELAVKEAESTPEIHKSTEELLIEARRNIRKFKRIENKLKHVGVI